jgi:hypothetical protein
MYSAKKQNLFVITLDVITSFQSMVLEYLNVNVNIHVTALGWDTLQSINNISPCQLMKLGHVETAWRRMKYALD